MARGKESDNKVSQTKGEWPEKEREERRVRG